MVSKKECPRIKVIKIFSAKGFSFFWVLSSTSKWHGEVRTGSKVVEKGMGREGEGKCFGNPTYLATLRYQRGRATQAVWMRVILYPSPISARQLAHRRVRPAEIPFVSPRAHSFYRAACRVQ